MPLLVLWGNKSILKSLGDVLNVWGDYSISKPIKRVLIKDIILKRETKRSNQLVKKFFIMSDLSKMAVCNGDIPPFDKSEIHKYLKK